MKCNICLINDQNLTPFKICDIRNYQELTGYNIVKANNLQICTECRTKLKESINFLKLCRKSYQNIQKYEIGNNQDDSCEINTDIAVNNEENFTSDNFILSEDVPIEIINEHEIIEVIEIEKVHNKDAKFSCSYDGCDKKFATEIRLKTHTRIHTNEKPYICDYDDCNMKFAQSNALLCHKRIHLNEKPYVCQVCGKRFTQNTTLKTHFAAKHFGNRIECDYPGCTKKFPRNSFLILHKKRDHENIRNYNCEICGKQYKQKSHLDRHIEATHKKIRHQCHICEKSFSKSWSLKLHLFKHTEASNFPYKCTECEMNFQRRDTWMKHMSKAHPGIDIKKDAIEINVPKDMMNKEMSKVT